MIFSFFLQISNHMWADQYTVRMPWSHQDPWSPNNNIDIDVFDRTLDFIAERKFNMIVIDVGDGVKLTSMDLDKAEILFGKKFKKKLFG